MRDGSNHVLPLDEAEGEEAAESHGEPLPMLGSYIGG